MSKLQSIIRPVPGGDGPFWVQSKKDDVDFNVTLTIANLSTALDQCKTDQAGQLSGEIVKQVVISTDTTPA
jgi:hypothetical protein